MSQTGSETIVVRKRRDYRPMALAAVFGCIVLLGGLVSMLTGNSPSVPVEAAATTKPSPSSPFASLKDAPTGKSVKLAEVEPPAPKIDPKDPQGSEARRLLNEAATQIKAKRYEDAIRMLHEARPLLQKHAQAYLLLGRALEGRKDYATARDFYEAAIDRDPFMSEAYWGYATTSESLGDLEAAMGGMRNYLHTEKNRDPGRLKIVQARSALWEWEAQLGRGPWGPTKGVPPGFTREELKRDGRGVGIKMPLPETATPDGRMKYEIKHQDKFQLYKPD